MLSLFAKAGLIIFFACVLSVGTDMLYRKSYSLPYKWPENIFTKAEISEKYRLVKLGSSHAEDGITFENYRVKSLNLSSVAQSYEYDLAMLRMYERQIGKDAVILINVSPISFSQKKPGKSDAFRYQYYDGRLSPFVIPHLQLGDYLQSQIVPFVRSAYLWREKYDTDMRALAMSSFDANWHKGDKAASAPATLVRSVPPSSPAPTTPTPKPPKMTPEEELALVRFVPGDTLVKSVDFMVTKWLKGDFGKEYFDTNRRDLEKLISYCLAHEWKPVLISIPISSKLAVSLGPEYMETYVRENLKKTNTRGIEYLNFQTMDTFTQNAFLFGNSDHLSGSGARIFSHFLLETLIGKGYLPKEADGY